MYFSKIQGHLAKLIAISRKQGVKHAYRKTKKYLRRQKQQVVSVADSFPRYQLLKQQGKPFKNIRVAAVLDEFSELAWGQEFELVPVTPGNFERILSHKGDSKIDLLLVESAWRGSGGAWNGHIVGPSAPSAELRTLVECAQENGIPAVFWNKEDPAHFDDFIDSARLFDYIFTTDEASISAYEKTVPNRTIEVLPFAAQPAIHNPIVEYGHVRGRDFVFGGTYFAEKFPSRKAQTERILSAAEQASTRLDDGLTIYSRFGHEDPKYSFPRQYRKYEKGFLPYDRMVTAYKNFKVVLNVNTVPFSPTMCSRRIFEAAACGAVVVSTEGRAVRSFFREDEVILLPEGTRGGKLLEVLARSPELTDRIAHRAQRQIWKEHTYTHRAQRIVELTGVGSRGMVEVVPTVSVVASTNRPDQIEHLLQQVAKQRNVNVECHILLHGIDVRPEKMEGILPSEVALHVYRHSAESTLGENLNFLVGQASAKYIAKFDDDDFYGEFYLRDQIDALMYSGADVVGKKASYIYIEGRDLFALRNPRDEHCFTDFVAGPTLVWRREVTEKVRFPDKNRGEDSSFLYDVTKNGMKIFSSDRFNFVQMRFAKSEHTWEADELELLANSKVVSTGSGPLNVEV